MNKRQTIRYGVVATESGSEFKRGDILATTSTRKEALEKADELNEDHDTDAMSPCKIVVNLKPLRPDRKKKTTRRKSA